MTTQTISIKCARCLGTGTDDNLEPPGPCEACGGDGLVGSGIIDTTELTAKIDALQTSIDQVAEVVKSSAEYIEKIYKIVSKEK